LDKDHRLALSADTLERGRLCFIVSPVMMDRCTLVTGLVLTGPLHIDSFSTTLLTSRIPRATSRGDDSDSDDRRRRRRNAPRVGQLAAGGTYLDSLSGIAENHHLFPQTSNALDALHGGARDASSTVSPQEFLASLSSELSRASEDYSSGVQAYERSSPSLTATQDPSSFLQGLAEQFAPAATSIAGVGYAADRHTDYSSVSGSSRWDFFEGQSGEDYMGGASLGIDQSTQTGVPDADQFSGSGMQQAGIGQLFDHTTGDHANDVASMAFTEATNSAQYGGSTAAWNSEGSHPLRDLASNISPDQADVQQNMASQYDASNFVTSANAASEANGYSGLGDAFHLSENANFDQMAQFVALEPKMSAPQINLEGGSLGSINKAPTAFEWTRSKFEAASSAINDGTFASSMDQAFSVAKQAGESSKQKLNDLLDSNSLSDLGSTVEGVASSSKEGGNTLSSLADMNPFSSLGSTIEGALSSAKELAADSSSKEKLSGLIESMAGSAGALGSKVSEATSKAFDGSTYSDLQPPKVSQGTFGIPKSPRVASTVHPVSGGGDAQSSPSSTLNSGSEPRMDSPDKWKISSEGLAGNNDVLPDTPLIEQQSRVQPPTEDVTPSEMTSQVSPLTDFKSEASLGQDVLPSTSVDTPSITDTQQLTTPTPQIESPPLPKPDVLSLDTSNFDATALPKVELQPPDAPSLPKADTLPEVSIPIEIRPPGQLQQVEPTLPSDFSTQGLPVPDVKTNVNVPPHPPMSNIKEIPSIPKIDFQPPKMPEFEVPSIPKFELDVPKMPSLNLRPPRMPELNLRGPQPHDAVPTSQIPKAVTSMEVPQSSDFHPSISNDVNPIASLDNSVSPFGDASLSDFGHAVLSSLHYIGEMFLKVIDSILNLVAGTSIEATLVATQTSISTTIDNASHSVVSTLNAIGDISIRDVFNGILTLILMIGDILLKATNAAVYLASGKDGAAWSLQAQASVHDASSYVASQYSSFTHTSMSEFASLIGDYSNQVSDQLVALLNTLDSSTLADSIPPDAIDGAMSAVQTAIAMQ